MAEPIVMGCYGKYKEQTKTSKASNKNTAKIDEMASLTMIMAMTMAISVAPEKRNYLYSVTIVRVMF